MSAAPPGGPAFFARWWIYQRERFPLAGHVPLIAAFSFCAVSYSRMLRTGSTTMPPWPALAVAFITCLLFFLELRIADEFKDFEEDSKFRPYRPVPRGLVTLRELGGLFVLAALAQLGAGWLLAPRMALLLLVPWIYLLGMSKEFWARDWLVARPIHYLWTHMLIMPLVDFYATGCDWLAIGAAPPAGLGWFLGASLFNGVVFEIGRKLRAPADEEKGVRTYTVLWSPPTATTAWLGALAATGLCAWQAARAIHFGLPVATTLGVLLLLAIWAVARFRRDPQAGRGKLFEAIAGAWTLALYLSLGALPLLFR
jgi:4-hydroxybenzoate polyprenyltransferase